MAREIETKCIHLEEEENSINHYGAISYPIYQSATYAHPGVGQSTGYDYSRLQNPTREHLEKTVASLENGIDALAFSSGMAAITLMMELFKPGDHLIVDADLYGGSIRLFNHVSEKNGIEFSSVDCHKENVAAYIRENTKAVAFRIIVARFPKVLISSGIVTIPTIIRVETNAAICIYPAPFFNSAAAKGKATNPGISVIEPITEAAATPHMPEFVPSSFVIVSGLNMASATPIIIKMDRN